MLQIDLLTDEPNIREVFDKAQFLPQANELTGWFDELDLAKIRRIVKYELGCMVQGNFAFNKYKLKYYKSMLYVKESMITGQKKDTEGDIDMAELNHDKQSISDTATPNDIEEPEGDDEVTNNHDDDEDAADADDDEFDPKSATFQEIIERISKIDSETAQRLARDLNGFIYETKM